MLRRMAKLEVWEFQISETHELIYIVCKIDDYIAYQNLKQSSQRGAMAH